MQGSCTNLHFAHEGAPYQTEIAWPATKYDLPASCLSDAAVHGSSGDEAGSSVFYRKTQYSKISFALQILMISFPEITTHLFTLRFKQIVQVIAAGAFGFYMNIQTVSSSQSIGPT